MALEAYLGILLVVFSVCAVFSIQCCVTALVAQ